VFRFIAVIVDLIVPNLSVKIDPMYTEGWLSTSQGHRYPVGVLGWRPADKEAGDYLIPLFQNVQAH
jgi:hypothetical protein